MSKIQDSIPNILETVNIKGVGSKHSGKVRDFYILGDRRILITTDRQSAFNYNLGLVPYKGAVLNQLSKFWFDRSQNIIPNHMIAIPDPNVMIAKNCKPIPIEMVVRGYMSGVTITSIWHSYQKGERNIYGIDFPNGLNKNEKLSKPMLTPTTHPDPESGSHDDERLTRAEILDKQIIPTEQYLQMEKVALELFKLGSDVCKKSGLILVDTKYEFGIYEDKLIQIDEMHTPDSSRFWIADTYEERISKGEEPDNFDKEFLRLYYTTKLGYKGTGEPQQMPEELTIDLAQRYIDVYEKQTGEKFELFDYPIEDRIRENVAKYLANNP
ncbi:phosphoribosylaminoimidazolesuccinocarboxamide synthase [Candidatus Roizmanbacteria bacterium CG22_combo_CG10-13_8_21_14_all_38_20]|uniref:Phosphoribosylaminoimidazole-succinocarboxamide synthase n=1 Tax=Candidatus Roizmanbacteria bacterium CG22_combo_CG10-13_8_21_14_all_38_20 TaxID=1974862 RepID=A0A2H0BVB7_9BACT|nr:phosphoribosylaminoimidazolesuccinocarboxamide synthase [Candidatus Microgenomates bacterium]PIP61544.1 MAG: phosphoribosylaminoimidazolesuccinocarboxamide synthase [Candidatus Roizmanbacteria bacterium CG22_combo_CG10-13_8_21_14_all_38_20]PJC31498.1 MAG: phosphoribosylaminoimidazolesuccinocarboxamide synthase [Candidatus Roizmanbacteria bacterium CG_4_9_14_0_2_um_filter_38_17]